MSEMQPPSSALDAAKRLQVDAALAALVDNGDLERIVGLARLVGSAQDAMTDDIVGRVASVAGDGLDLMDKVTRSGVAQALPAIAALVDNGDLDRIVGLARLVGSAQDAMTDDIVGRVASVAGDGIDLVDQITRSGVVRALPSIAQLVDNGDLDRIVGLARLIGAMQDSLTDDMIVRLAGVASHGIHLLERMTRTGLADQLLALAATLERSGLAPDLLDAVDAASRQIAAQPTPKGGMSGLMSLMGLLQRPETLRTIEFAISILGSLYQARLARGADKG